MVEEDGTTKILDGFEFTVYNRRKEEHTAVEEDRTTKIPDGFQAAAQEGVKAKCQQEHTVVEEDGTTKILNGLQAAAQWHHWHVRVKTQRTQHTAVEEDGTTKILDGFEFIVYNRRKEEHTAV